MTITIPNQNAFKIFQIFEDEMYQIRLIGGCVRDLSSGAVPHDYDFSTDALPADIISILDKNDIRHIEPGLDHGTITAIVDRDVFEITTLRIDEDHDGRHAKVKFTADWKVDAARRDFTMNAMSMNSAGEIFDYFNGQADVKASKIKFVGDIRKRIEEDYLRILRYFRFVATKGFEMDTKDLKIIQELCPEIFHKVSKERIKTELEKTFGGESYYDVDKAMIAMLECGIFKSMGWDFDYERFMSIMQMDMKNRVDTTWGCFVKNVQDAEDLFKFFGLTADTREFLKNSITMRKFPITKATFLELKYIAKIPVKHINRFFDDEPDFLTLQEIKIDTVKLMSQGFKGKDLGDEILRLTREKIEEVKYT